MTPTFLIGSVQRDGASPSHPPHEECSCRARPVTRTARKAGAARVANETPELDDAQSPASVSKSRVPSYVAVALFWNVANARSGR